ncbi:hypothetical protein OG730_15125 [Streptomyces sp. NBC_01298]|uniref:hypothetical protein n=1 Tax=Streptomyces sp. NBC_01298 TaxID=2903817 RepID=UPI002E0E7742|nr:hypothetical protein OG730_15125 [Streptomyces sp. NBC_01298]
MSTTFNLDLWVREARREPFRFTLADAEYSMPSAGEIDKSILETVNVVNPSTADITTLLRTGLGDQWERFNALPLPLAAVGELFRQWQNYEGAPLGEFPASADS